MMTENGVALFTDIVDPTVLASSLSPAEGLIVRRCRPHVFFAASSTVNLFVRRERSRSAWAPASRTRMIAADLSKRLEVAAGNR